MDDAKELWSQWQELLSAFQGVFTVGGWARFAQWVTGTVLCPEEHTITQILTAEQRATAAEKMQAAASHGRMVI